MVLSAGGTAMLATGSVTASDKLFPHAPDQRVKEPRNNNGSGNIVAVLFQ